MECPICLCDWTTKFVPLNLNCGHAYCRECIEVICKDSIVKCPLCKVPTKIDDITNINKQLHINLTFLERYHYLPEKHDQQYEECCMNIELVKAYLCPEHNLPIHSYNQNMLEIYCTACLNENQLNDDIFPLPQIENSLKHAINCQRVKYEQVLLQLDDFKTNLEYQFELLKDCTRVEIGSLYEGTDEFIQLAKWEHLNRTEQGFQRSSDELNSYLALIQRIEEDINGEIKQLNSIFKSVLNFEEILNLCKINPSEYTNEILKYNEKEDQKICKTTSFSSLTTTDFGKWSELNEYDEIQSSIKNWFDISKFWYCPTCRTKNIQEDNEIICSACCIFKPIELYESFFTNKRYASHHDINLISKRKNLEQNLINKMYIINDATNDCFIIDENWVKKCENFVYNKITEYDLQNIINPFDIKFIPFPDLVSNNDLSANYSSIKENIHSNSYRAINEEVWNHLYFTYNCGHKLNKGSIHSKELENQSFIKIQRKIDSIIFQNLSKQLEVQLLKEKERKYKAELKRFETKNCSILKLFNLMSSSQNEKSKDEENSSNNLEFYLPNIE